MENNNYHLAAALNYGSPALRKLWQNTNKPLRFRDCVQVSKKCVLPRIPLTLTSRQSLIPKGFFASIVAVTTTKDSSLESAGCGVKTGWCMPLAASLAALVKRLHNLTAPKRQMVCMRINLPVTRTWFLPVHSKDGEVVKSLCLSCPFGELLPK